MSPQLSIRSSPTEENSCSQSAPTPLRSRPDLATRPATSSDSIRNPNNIDLNTAYPVDEQNFQCAEIATKTAPAKTFCDTRMWHKDSPMLRSAREKTNSQKN